MAITENYIDKITKDGQSRMISPAADMVRVNSEEYEGDNLGDVLDEIADAVSDAASSADLSGLFAAAAYNSTTKEINFLDKNNTVVATIDAKPFVRDGMVSSVSLSNGVLTITFNTDAGKEPISVSLGDLFDADNYYTKTDVDGKFVVQVNGKGLSSNDYSDADKAAVATIADKADKTTVPDAYQPRLLAGTGISISGDTISVAEAVRNGAAAGATAVQTIKVNGTAQTKTDGVVNIQSVDGVTPHIGANGNWFIGTTDTDVKARGVDGINVSDPADIEVVHNLDDEKSENFDPTSQVAVMGSDMGKVLKVAISTLIDSMGEYCFPMGRPTLSFEGPKADIIHTFNNSHVALSNTAQRVDIGASFETTLGTDDNLYVINDSSVKVYMSGVEQSGAYNASTQKVTLAEVTGNVVIVAEAWTYVQGAVVLLDGLNIGSNTNQWANLANDQKPLVLSGGYTKNSNNVAFDGVDGTGIIDGLGIDLQDDASTAEIVMSLDDLPPRGYFLTSGYNHNTILAVVESGSRCLLTSQTVQYGGNISTGAQAAYLDSGENQFLFAANQIISLSRQGRSFTLNNASLTPTTTTFYAIVGGPNMSEENTYDASGKLFISGIIARKGQYLYPMKGKMYCVRIYNRVLTTQERTQNYNIDKKRFNLA